MRPGTVPVYCADQESRDVLKFLEKLLVCKKLGGFGELRAVVKDGRIMEWYVTSREHVT
jgi:hypothetical protein